VRRCWDLKGLDRDYRRFLRRYRPAYAEARAAFGRGRPLPPAECFRQRFWLTFDYALFPRRDPNLPQPLLPPEWSGNEAAQVFLGYHALLQPPSELFVGEALTPNLPAGTP
jgi:phenylacetic acid degradation operon negative regulatory protein